MAVGFGQHMPNSPMVITWPNPDGSITISQREALAHVMPTYIPNPPQKANLVLENSILAANSTTIAFTYPTPSPLNAVNMIFAYCLTRPSSSAPDATLQQHLDMGTFTIDLTQPMNALPTGIISTAVIGSSTEIVAATPTGAPASSTPIAASVFPLTPEEERIRTHGILMSIGFLVLLPLGVFIARFSRTIPFLQRKWFTAHWVVQFIVSGPIIFAGWALGYQHVQRTGGGHFQDSHTSASDPEKHLDAPANPPRSPASSATMNVTDSPQATFSDLSGSPPRKPTATTPAPRPLSSALSPDYLPSKAPKVNRYEALFNRPLQNYGHAINGLVIIALAFHNVREGYHDEWEQEFGENYKMRAFLRHLNTCGDLFLFEGGDSTKCDEFIRYVRIRVFKSGMAHDNLWAAKFAATCLGREALRWHLTLDLKIRDSWIELEKALVKEYSSTPPPSRLDEIVEDDSGSIPRAASASALPSYVARIKLLTDSPETSGYISRYHNNNGSLQPCKTAKDALWNAVAPSGMSDWLGIHFHDVDGLDKGKGNMTHANFTPMSYFIDGSLRHLTSFDGPAQTAIWAVMPNKEVNISWDVGG
ncbi:hypothetical protein FRB99_008069, partial [Tulasnella sp. 403]